MVGRRSTGMSSALPPMVVRRGRCAGIRLDGSPLATTWTWTGSVAGHVLPCSGCLRRTRRVGVPGRRPRRQSAPCRRRPRRECGRDGRYGRWSDLSWTAPASDGWVADHRLRGPDYSGDGGADVDHGGCSVGGDDGHEHDGDGADQRDGVSCSGSSRPTRVGTGPWSATSRRVHPARDGAWCADGCGWVERDVDVDRCVVDAAGCDGGSAIIRYVVSASTDGGATWSLFGYPSTAQPLATTWTWTGLTPGTSYRFRVFAQNAAGWSQPSAASAAVSTLSTPSAPRNVSGTAGNGQVALSWQAPASHGWFADHRLRG